jgi:hypothetical protein
MCQNFKVPKKTIGGKVHAAKVKKLKRRPEKLKRKLAIGIAIIYDFSCSKHI